MCEAVRVSDRVLDLLGKVLLGIINPQSSVQQVGSAGGNWQRACAAQHTHAAACEPLTRSPIPQAARASNLPSCDRTPTSCFMISFEAPTNPTAHAIASTHGHYGAVGIRIPI